MAGEGKYTNYAPPADAAGRNERLNKLFKGNAKQSSPYQDLVGKEEDVRKALLKIAKDKLTPEVQDSGDASVSTFAGAPVRLNYTGDANDISVPDTKEGADVVWVQPGDSANAYAPDLRSPGPGQTDAPSAENLQSDPKLSVKDLKGEKYVPGAPGTGTTSPTSTNVKVRSASELGKTGKSVLGTSDENTPFE